MQCFFRLCPFQHTVDNALVADADDVQPGAFDSAFQLLAQVADDFGAFVDDFQPDVFVLRSQFADARHDGIQIAADAFQSLEYGDAEGTDRRDGSLKFDEANAFLLPRFTEAHRKRGAAVPDGVGVIDGLRYMKMPQRDIVQVVREDAGGDVGEGTDVQFPYTVTVDCLATRGEEMPHRHDGNIAAEFLPLLFGKRGDVCVMRADAFEQFLFFLVGAFTGFGCPDIAITEIGDGTDDQFGIAVFIMQYQNFFFRRMVAVTDDMDVECLEQLLRCVEKGGRVVIAGDDDDMPAGRADGSPQKTVIQFLRTGRWRAVVEYVARHQQGADFVPPDCFGQPVQKGFEFVITLSAVQRAAEVPVGSVKDFHENVGLVRIEAVFGKKLFILPPNNGLFRYERNKFQAGMAEHGGRLI